MLLRGWGHFICIAPIFKQIRYRAPQQKGFCWGRQGQKKQAAGVGSCDTKLPCRHRRSPALRLHAPTAGTQGPRQLDMLLPGLRAQKVLVGAGDAHVENVDAHFLKTSNAKDEQGKNILPA